MKDAEALLQALLQKSGKTDRSMTYLGKLLAKEAFGVKSQIDAERARTQQRRAPAEPIRTIRIEIGQTPITNPTRTKPTKAKATKSGSNTMATVVLALIALILAALFF